MEIKINQLSENNVEHIISIFFDLGGNLYFKFNDVIYDLNINSTNMLECDVCNINVNDLEKINVSYEELKLIDSPNSLKGKIKKEIDVNDIHCSDEHKYLYENEDYIDYDDDSDYEDQNEFVKFMSTGEKIEVYDFDMSVSLYDTIIYNDDIEHGSICFKTNIINMMPPYRLKLYKNGIISFRSLGDKEIYYNITIQSNTIQLVPILN